MWRIDAHECVWYHFIKHTKEQTHLSAQWEVDKSTYQYFSPNQFSSSFVICVFNNKASGGKLLIHDIHWTPLAIVKYNSLL